ncbi:MAG: hypothetical protein AAFO69_21845, partial [Bacteroidota bacterium]
MRTAAAILLLSLIFLQGCQTRSSSQLPTKSADLNTNDYQALVDLFREWRTFEKPPLLDGAPDYTAATFEKRWPQFKSLQSKLQAIDTTTWSIAEKVDW